MGNGGSIGPYAVGKIYCGFCGEFRRYGENVVTNKTGLLVCTECGIHVRTRGRHWTQTTKEEPKRY